MVTWGQNTVNVFNNSGSTPAPASSGFSTPAPASSGFNTPTAGSSTSFFGSTTPAPATPTTPTTGFGFGQSKPIQSPGSSLFSPAPAPAAGGFGFGSTTPAAAPATNTAFANVLGAPQQAALQAHMNAGAQQEASRLENQLRQLHAAYTPNNPQPNQNQETTCRFQHIFYDPITQAQRLEKLSLPNSHYPPKPPHIPTETWHQALTQNPDPEEYIPTLVTSASGLHSRIVAQQSKMKLHDNYIMILDETLEKRKKFHEAVLVQLQEYNRKNILLRSRLQNMMRKFEICRGKNVPLQEAEREAVRKLMEINQMVKQVDRMMEVVKRDGEDYAQKWRVLQQEKERRRRMSSGTADAGDVEIEEPVKEEVMELLNGHRKGIDEMIKVVKTGERDVEIMKNDGRPVRV